MSQNDNIFGERLRQLRNSKNMTQKDFAQEMNIPQPTLSSYEVGKIKPTIDAVINIADRCNVSIDWLCGRDSIIKLHDLGDVMACFSDLFATNEFDIKTIIHDRVDLEEPDAVDDKDRNWIDLKIYHREDLRNPQITLNVDLCTMINKAYRLTQDLKQFQITQENYEREKAHYIEYGNRVPLTKVNHTGIPEDEQRKKMLEFLKNELEELNNKTDE